MDYARTAVRALLGATAHPGGEALTRHVLDRLALPPGSLLADVACGDGAALRLAAARGVLAVGVDLEPRARPTAVGDAHALPLRTGAYDAVLCECALSTFTDPARALAEVRRVLRPGGAFAMTDVVLRRDLAPPEVVTAVDRLTGARSVPEYVALVEAAGLRVERVEDRAADARALARRVARRLALVGARETAAAARECARAAEAGGLSYALVLARR